MKPKAWGVGRDGLIPRSRRGVLLDSNVRLSIPSREALVVSRDGDRATIRLGLVVLPGRRRSAVELRTMVREALARSFREEHPDGTFRGFESIERISLRRPAEVLVRWRLRR